MMVSPNCITTNACINLLIKFPSKEEEKAESWWEGRNTGKAPGHLTREQLQRIRHGWSLTSYRNDPWKYSLLDLADFKT